MSDFEPVTLNDCIKLKSGNTPSKSRPDFWNGNFPWISAKDMKTYWLDGSEDQLTEAGSSAAARAEAGTTLLLVRGMTLHNDIPICRVRCESSFNQDVKAVYPKPGIGLEFVPYLLLGNKRKIQGIVDAAGHGTGRLNTDQLLSIPVFRPSSAEQEKIVETVSSLDEKIELNRKQNRTLEAIAQALFKRWFVEFEFPDKNGQPYKSSGGAMQASELGEIPVGWEIGKIGDAVEILGGGTPSTTVTEFWDDGDIDWYSPTDLTKTGTLYSQSSRKKITQVGLRNSSAKLFPAYSLMMTSRATIGVVSINRAPACTNQGFITLIPNEEFSLYQLHGWLLQNMPLIHSKSSGTTFKEISRGSFKDFDIIKTNVGSKYAELVEPVYRKIEVNTLEIESLTAIRDTLLPKLMSGELRVAS